MPKKSLLFVFFLAQVQLSAFMHLGDPSDYATIAGKTVQFPSGLIYTLFQLRGNFSLSLGDKPQITMRTGFQGIGFVTREGQLRTVDSKLQLTGDAFTFDLDPENILFFVDNFVDSVGTSYLVPLTVVHAHVKGQKDPLADLVIQQFFNGPNDLSSCSYSNVLGYRDQNSTRPSDFYVLLYPKIKKLGEKQV